ncbi:MAG: hypothetical protein QM762_04815 [Chryseolinea sp.]
MMIRFAAADPGDSYLRNVLGGAFPRVAVNDNVGSDRRRPDAARGACATSPRMASAPPKPRAARPKTPSLPATANNTAGGCGICRMLDRRMADAVVSPAGSGQPRLTPTPPRASIDHSIPPREDGQAVLAKAVNAR